MISDAKRQAIRARKKSQVAKGLCSDCNLPLSSKYFCRNHQLKHNESARISAKRLYDERTAAGLCFECGAKTNGLVRCKYHQDQLSQTRKRKRQNVRSI